MMRKNLEYVVCTGSSYLIPDFEEERDYDSGAIILRVSKNEMPENVLGSYDPTHHVIRIRNDLSMNEEMFVGKHESGHARGIIDEGRTDAYAASLTGYNLRGAYISKLRVAW